MGVGSRNKLQMAGLLPVAFIFKKKGAFIHWA